MHCVSELVEEIFHHLEREQRRTIDARRRKVEMQHDDGQLIGLRRHLFGALDGEVAVDVRELVRSIPHS